MNKKLLITTLSLASVLGLGALSAYAATTVTGAGDRGPDSANRQAVVIAIENADYDAWKEAVGDCPLAEKITADSFSKYIEAYNLREQARQIEEELGITGFGDRGPGDQGPKGNGPDSKNRQAIMTAIENSDYSAWKEAIGNSPMAEKITEENFAKFVEAHTLRQAGKFDEASQIEEELGIKMGGPRHGQPAGFSDN